MNLESEPKNNQPQINDSEVLKSARQYLDLVTLKSRQIEILKSDPKFPGVMLEQREVELRKLKGQPDEDPGLRQGIELLREEERRMRAGKKGSDIQSLNSRVNFLTSHQALVGARVKLEPGKREAYLALAKPPAQEARETHSILKKEAGLRDLEEQLRRAALGLGDSAPSAVLGQYLGELSKIRQERKALNAKHSLVEVAQQFQASVNTLRRAVNDVTSSQLIEQGVIPPQAAVLVAKALSHTSRKSIAERVVSAPPLSHNDLGEMVLYREEDTNAKLRYAILRESERRWPGRTSNALLSLSVSKILAQHLTVDHWVNMPVEFVNPDPVAYQIAEFCGWLDDYREGKMESFPTGSQLGQRGPKQGEYIYSYIQTTLLEIVNRELLSPNMSEKDTRKLYQSLSNQIRALARWVSTSQFPNEGYEMVAREIDRLPDVPASLLVARLSNKLYKDLGFPGWLFISEERMASMLRTVAFISNETERGHAADKIIDVLNDRIEQNDISLGEVFRQIKSLDYGTQVIRNLSNAANSAARGVLIQALKISGEFDSLIEELENEDREVERYEYRKRKKQ